jgi:hypothetical protein
MEFEVDVERVEGSFHKAERSDILKRTVHRVQIMMLCARQYRPEVPHFTSLGWLHLSLKGQHEKFAISFGGMTSPYEASS